MSGPPSAARRAVIGAALLTAYVQAVTISLPNAAILHMRGGLAMADDELGWIFTSYIAASAVTLPMAGRLAGRLGRKPVFLAALAGFAIGLLLAARATDALPFVFARIVQGAASGLLGPLSLAILLDRLPAERHAPTGLAWTLATLAGLLSGPGLGGWIAEYHGWPTIFLAGLPVAAAIGLAIGLLLDEQRADPGPPLDLFGLASFSLFMVGLQMLLDRGERLDWFASIEIRAEAFAAALGLGLYAVHVLTTDRHFLAKALLRDRNFLLSTIIFFAFGFVLLPTIALTSPMLEELLGYPADTTGYMTIPRSLALAAGFLFAARPPVRIDDRWLLAAGMALVVYGNGRMLGYSPLMDWRAVVAAGAVQSAGLGLMMPALSRTAFATLDPALRAEGNVLFNLARLHGSTIGIAVVQLFFFEATQKLHLAFAAQLTPYRFGAGRPSAPALAGLNELITGQAAMIAIIGQFKLLMIVMALAGPLALFLRAPRAATEGAVR